MWTQVSCWLHKCAELALSWKAKPVRPERRTRPKHMQNLNSGPWRGGEQQLKEPSTGKLPRVEATLETKKKPFSWEVQATRKRSLHRFAPGPSACALLDGFPRP